MLEALTYDVLCSIKKGKKVCTKYVRATEAAAFKAARNGVLLERPENSPKPVSFHLRVRAESRIQCSVFCECVIK